MPPIQHAASAAAAGVVGVPGGCHVPGLFQGDQSVIGAGFFKNILGSVPGTLLRLSKFPGMAFAARKVATGLIDG